MHLNQMVIVAGKWAGTRAKQRGESRWQGLVHLRPGAAAKGESVHSSIHM